MKYLDFKENQTHGSINFPFAYYNLNYSHPRYIMPEHWHDEFEIIHIISGSLDIRINTFNYTAKKGDILFIQSGFVHSGVPTDCEYECLVFDFSSLLKQNNLINTEINNILLNKKQIKFIFNIDDGLVYTLLYHIFQIMKLESIQAKLKIYGSLYYFLGLVDENNFYAPQPFETSENLHSVSKIKDTIKFVQSNYMNNITLKDIAKLSYMNEKYFCSFFKKVIGKSPIEYLNYYRIESACEHLNNANKTITEIAFCCGYNDLSYFIKVFKKYKGVSPKNYINMHN